MEINLLLSKMWLTLSEGLCFVNVVVWCPQRSLSGNCHVYYISTKQPAVDTKCKYCYKIILCGSVRLLQKRNELERWNLLRFTLIMFAGHTSLSAHCVCVCRVCECSGDPHRHEVHHRPSCSDAAVDRALQRSVNWTHVPEKVNCPVQNHWNTWFLGFVSILCLTILGLFWINSQIITM